MSIQIPGCLSLKDKRSRIKPLLARLHKEFNISVAEINQLDSWQHAQIACVMVSNDRVHIHSSLQHVRSWIERNWPDINLIDEKIELI